MITGFLFYKYQSPTQSKNDDYGKIFLTLDSKAAQQAFFIAEPQGGVTMQVWGRNNNKISIGAYDDTIAFDMKLDTNNENLI